MARLPYKEDQSIHSMNTRQLRQYIADQAAEAEKRLESAPKKPTRAFEDLRSEITFGSGKVKKSTSYMNKAEMREYAYTLRMFNKMDTESKYAAKTDWQQNKKRYESFIRNQISKSGDENQYWAKYVLPSGNISKKGYQEYKDFIAVLKASDEYLKSFGYRDIQQYAQDKKSNLDPGNEILNRTIAKVYNKGKGQGYTQAEMLKELKKEYEDALSKENQKNRVSTKKPKVSTKKTKKKASKSNIKVKTGKKMKSGTIRNRQS